MEFDRFYQNLAKRIKDLRRINKLTQEQLAESTGLSTDYIGKIETCINKPGIKSILKIIKAFNVNMGDFFKDL